MEENKNSKWTKIFAILAIVFFISTVYLWIKLNETQNNVKEVTIVKEIAESKNEDLIQRLDNLQAQYDSLGSKYSELDSMFTIEKDRIVKIKNELKKSKVNEKKYKEQINILEKRLTEYLQKIQELTEQNKALTAENINLKTNIDSALKITEQLSSEKEELSSKIQSSSYLKAYEIIAEAIKESKNDNDNEITSKAKKVGKIRVCFTLGENKLINSGPKTIYVRLIDPNGIVMLENVEESHSIVIDKKRIFYSQKQEIFYNGVSTKVCINWKNTKKLIAGEYNVEIYTDEYKIGETSLILK